jgi:hypothetical protein
MKAADFFRVELDPEDIPQEWILERIRNWRNSELLKSDWTQVADAPVNQAAWATYRQALRDLPASKKEPKAIELPVAP